VREPGGFLIVTQQLQLAICMTHMKAQRKYCEIVKVPAGIHLFQNIFVIFIKFDGLWSIFASATK
jgi:hypothetical protein